MGLISAVLGAAGGTLADSWKEFFYCDALSDDVLMSRGFKQTTGRSSNTKGNDNVITNGSGVAVADGQCMIILENGKVVDVCATPGKYIYKTDIAPTIFAPDNGLWNSIKATFADMGQRIGYGGDPGKDQRIYFFNTKHIMNNLFGTGEPIPFRVVDARLGLDIDTQIKCSGNYVFRIADPLLFYTNVCGNAAQEYRKETLTPTLKGEFVDALFPAFSEISNMEIRPNAIPGKKDVLKKAINEALADNWGRLKGLEVVEVNIKVLNIPKEDQELIKSKQARASDIAMMSDPTAAGAALVGGTIDAMNTAAGNTNGAVAGFAGMGFGMGGAAMGGGMAGSLFAQGQQQQAYQQQFAQQQGYQQGYQQPPQQPQAAPQAPAGDSWQCSCGAVNTGKFCTQCGNQKPAPQPAAASGWQCSCGSVNQGQFCPQCGARKPAEAPLYRCDKCGWVPEDPKNPPKFCPQCGDVFDNNDIQ